MRSLDVIMMVIIPLALAALLGLVVISGRLSAGARRMVERALVVLAFGVSVVVGGSALVMAIRQEEWLGAAGLVVLAAMLVWQATSVLRRNSPERDGA